MRRVAVNIDRLRAAGIIAPPELQHRHASQVRAVKSQLLKALRKDPRDASRIIMVTSSLPGEGKTLRSRMSADSSAYQGWKDFSTRSRIPVSSRRT